MLASLCLELSPWHPSMSGEWTIGQPMPCQGMMFPLFAQILRARFLSSVVPPELRQVLAEHPAEWMSVFL